MGSMSLTRHKLIVPQVKVVDVAKGQIRAVVSTEAVDRDGDIIRVAGWKLENFLLHPVLLSSHNYGSLRSVIGEWESMQIKQRPPRLEGVARYYIGEGNEEADWAFKLAEKSRAAFSVGFIPEIDKATELENDGGRSFFGSYEYNGQELLEVSQVSIPSNPEALQQLKGLMEWTNASDPACLALVTATLREMLELQPKEPPQLSIDFHGLLQSTFAKAYREVYPW